MSGMDMCGMNDQTFDVNEFICVLITRILVRLKVKIKKYKSTDHLDSKISY